MCVYKFTPTEIKKNICIEKKKIKIIKQNSFLMLIGLL